MRAPEGTGVVLRSDRDRKGAAMGGTTQRPSMAGYRDAVTELIRSGAPFGDVEDAIDELAHVSVDDRAALWLLAFALRDPAGEELDARTPPSSVLAPGPAR